MRPLVKPPHMTEETRRAVASREYDAVIAGGGDGTVNCAASALAGTDVALGVLPMGTLNHFAKHLGMPPALDDACAALAHAAVRSVDVGAVRSACTRGSSATARSFSAGGSEPNGWRCYSRRWAGELRVMAPPTFRAACRDDQPA